MKSGMNNQKQKKLARAAGASIARMRAEAELTQEEVAERMDIGNEAVSRIERGVVTPTLSRLFEFADLFDCRVDKLLLEASDRDTDQAATIAHQLTGLSTMDRELVAGIVNQLAAHFGKKSVDRLGKN